MRFHRKIPDIRPPVPGRSDVSLPSPWIFSSGWTCALVYVFLHAVLGIWFLCTARLGGEMAVIWLEPRALGLSLFGVASLVNGALLVFVLGSSLTGGRAGRSRDWKRLAGLLFALGILGYTQLYLNGWKRTAEWDLDRSQAQQVEQGELVQSLRASLEALAEHPWAGEYVTVERGRQLRLFLLPDSRAVFVYLDDDSGGAAPPAGLRPIGVVQRSVAVEGGRLLVEQQRRGEPVRYAVVQDGERRYLVMNGQLAGFLEATGAPRALYPGVYGRAGDEPGPLGEPRVVEDLDAGR